MHVRAADHLWYGTVAALSFVWTRHWEDFYPTFNEHVDIAGPFRLTNYVFAINQLRMLWTVTLHALSDVHRDVYCSWLDKSSLEIQT